MTWPKFVKFIYILSLVLQVFLFAREATYLFILKEAPPSVGGKYHGNSRWVIPAGNQGVQPFRRLGWEAQQCGFMQHQLSAGR